MKNYIYNILSTLAVISIYFDLEKLDKFFFNDYKFPEGRGDLNIIKFFNINYPLLIIPFLSRSSEIINKPIHVILDEGKYILNSNKTILTNIEKRNNSNNSKELTIQFEENKNLFTDTEWKELYKLSEDTFVPETDSLKNSAAGAGLTDND